MSAFHRVPKMACLEGADLAAESPSQAGLKKARPIPSLRVNINLEENSGCPLTKVRGRQCAFCPKEHAQRSPWV